MATTPPPTACTLPNSAAHTSGLIDHALRLNGWHKRGRELQTCGTLLPAHTGTSRLAWTVSQRSRFARHLHQDFFEDQYGRGARCFFMTVRDPVARLQSAFSFEKSHVNWGQDQHLNSNIRHTKSPGHFVRLLRDGKEARPDVRTPQRQAAVVKIFNGSLHGHRRWGQRGREVLHTGNYGLIPQLDYLRGLEGRADVELHLVCQNQLDRHLDAAWRKFEPGQALPPLPPEEAAKSTSQHKTTLHNKYAGDRTWLRLTADERAYVRECMFPGDAELARRLCHGNNASGLP